MRKSLFLGSAATLVSRAFAGDTDWVSPVYKEIFQNPMPIPPNKAVTYTYTNETTGKKIDFYEVEVKPYYHQVYAGKSPARLVGYDGMSPGPTFRIEKGRESVVRFKNKADKDFAVHLHGSYSRAPFDGWAEDVTKPGEYKDYYYPNSQSARTLWYHDHAVHHTAENAYFGQAGFYIIHDPAEDVLKLPSGAYDLPLALSAKQYNQDGTLFDPKDERVSLYGDVIHVNGQPWPYHKVEPRKYRMRWLDAAISRTFTLTFVDDAGAAIPFQVIGSDTGLLTQPVTSRSLEIAMAERWEIVFDFSKYAGKNVTVKNARDVQADEDYNSTDKVMRFVVGTTVSDNTNNGDVPNSLRTISFPPNTGKIDRHFSFHRSNGEWQINGVTFADVRNRILANTPRGTVEVWELENSSGGWSHPIHIHLVDFQIISRTGGKRGVLNYEKPALKDVVLLGEGETVKVIARYAPYDGVYMFHCHNLIHEDHDMMAAFNITELKNWGYPETTRFLDPMEERWRSKPITPEIDTYQARKDKCALFDSTEAYSNVDKLETALENYWNNGGPSGNSGSGPNSGSGSGGSAASSAAASGAAPSPTTMQTVTRAASITAVPKSSTRASTLRTTTRTRR